MIYRATAKFTADIVPAATTPRAPGNVPFFVDNIWEWLRPSGYPSRRFAAFASPRREQAADSAGCSPHEVYRVQLAEKQPICQIVAGKQPEDAKFHADIGRLKKLVVRALPNEWFSRPFAARGAEALLFLPCASHAELEELMRKTELLDPERISAVSTFWQDVQISDASMATDQLHATGEIFFEGSYRLL
jgi:hypothetical protein